MGYYPKIRGLLAIEHFVFKNIVLADVLPVALGGSLSERINADARELKRARAGGGRVLGG